MHLGLDATPQRRTLIKVITSNKYEAELIAFARSVGLLQASSTGIGAELPGSGGAASTTFDSLSAGGVSGGGGVRGRTQAGVASAAAQRKDAAAVAAIGTGHPKVQELIGTWQRAGRTRADILLLGRSGVGKSRLVNDIVGMGSELTAEGAWHSQTQRIAPFVIVLNGVRRGDDLARATLEVHVWDTPGLDDEVAYVALLYLHFTFYPLQRYGETFSLLTNPHNSIAPFAYHPPFRYEGTGYKEDRDVVQRHEQTLVGNLRSKIPRVDGSCPLFFFSAAYRLCLTNHCHPPPRAATRAFLSPFIPRSIGPLPVAIYCIRMDDARIRHEDADIISILDAEFGGWIWSRLIVGLTFANAVHPNVRPDPGAVPYRSLSGALFASAVQRKTEQVRLMIEASRRTHARGVSEQPILVVPVGACGLGINLSGGRGFAQSRSTKQPPCGSGATNIEVLWHLGGWDWIADLWRAALSLPIDIAKQRSLAPPMPPVQPASWILACEVTRCAVGGAAAREREQLAMKSKAHKTRGADAFEASRDQEALVRSKNPLDVDVGVGSAANENNAVARGGSVDGEAAARAYNPGAASAAAYGDASAAGDVGAERATVIAAAAIAGARDEHAATLRSALPGAAVLSAADLAALHHFVEYPRDRAGALLGEVRELLRSRLGIPRALLRSSTKAKLVPLAIYLQVSVLYVPLQFTRILLTV